MNENVSLKNGNKFRLYGWCGILLICFAEGALVAHRNGSVVAHYICVWTTPICWAGYLLFIDGLINKMKGSSLIYNRRKEFFIQVVLSILFWAMFEVYNFHLKNWEYMGLPENGFELYPGLAVSFGAIMPGLLMTGELIEGLRLFDRFRITKLNVSNRVVYGGIVLGFLFVMFPLLIRDDIAKYLFGLVWVGFVMIFDPIVYASKGESLLKQLEEGRLGRILSLFTAGLICGFLWEFWNYWATSKWVYKAPFTQEIKIFEMPLIGFLGFAPFAWEYFSFYNFCKLFARKKGEKA